MTNRGIDDTAAVPTIDALDYASLVAASPDVNTVSDTAGVFRYVSLASRRLFGWEPKDLEGRIEDEFVHPEDLLPLQTSRIEMSTSDFVTATFRFECRDGSYLWVERTSHFVRLQGWSGFVSVMRDITERLRQADILQAQAYSDPLTGVANRTVLMDRLRHALHHLGRGDGALAVLYLDLDRFKVINDSLGHRVGDQVLSNMAERLTHHLRPSDTLARLGGDEFVIVADGLVDEPAALDLANRVIEAGHRPFIVEDEALVCTLSAGVAWTSDAGRSAEDLLREADLALYRAKDRGRDRAELFDERLRTTAVSRMVTERMLRHAIDEDRVVVEYQPIVDIRSRRLTGVEALVRVMQSDDQLVQPGSFLVVASETGMLTSIDELVLADAVAQAVGWRSRPDQPGRFEVAVNITARHLADSRFADSIIEQLEAAGVDPDRLQIEVTEQVLMEASNSAMSSLRLLRGAGVQVGLDDFGTGYSSLAYFRQFPLDFVKIDQSFIHGLDCGIREQSIVAAIIGLSHALDLVVVAEGVETQSQLDVLETLGCDRAQGFFFSPSLHPVEINLLATTGTFSGT